GRKQLLHRLIIALEVDDLLVALGELAIHVGLAVEQEGLRFLRLQFEHRLGRRRPARGRFLAGCGLVGRILVFVLRLAFGLWFCFGLWLVFRFDLRLGITFGRLAVLRDELAG